MQRYRFKDLLLLPSLLSAARFPLALLFARARSRKAQLAILGAAAVTDVLDGFLARKLDQATATGALVDGTADKVFGVTVVATLMQRKSLSPAAAFLLATRELFELPLALRVVASKSARDADVDRSANRAGKLATAVELCAVLASIVVPRIAPALMVVAGATGVVAGVSYWKRELDVHDDGPPTLRTARIPAALAAHV